MDIDIEINQMIKLNDYKIKDNTKWMINQVDNMLIWPFIFLKNL